MKCHQSAKVLCEFAHAETVTSNHLSKIYSRLDFCKRISIYSKESAMSQFNNLIKEASSLYQKEGFCGNWKQTFPKEIRQEAVNILFNEYKEESIVNQEHGYDLRKRMA